LGGNLALPTAASNWGEGNYYSEFYS
jgi:hypothetical protein